jgi:hypothetical protein
MRRETLVIALVIVVVSAGAAMAGAVQTAASVAQACAGAQTEVQGEMVATNRFGESVPNDDAEAQPNGSWPDCPAQYTCNEGCHRDFFSCTEHPFAGGHQVCGWDGSINPPEFACNKTEIIWVQNCDCVPNVPGNPCISETQTLFCD